MGTPSRIVVATTYIECLKDAGEALEVDLSDPDIEYLGVLRTTAGRRTQLGCSETLAFNS
jgi:hypothetical protein